MYKYSTVDGIVNQKSINFQVMIPGNQPIAGYCYQEIDQFLGNDTQQSAESQNKKNTRKHIKY